MTPSFLTWTVLTAALLSVTAFRMPKTLNGDKAKEFFSEFMSEFNKFVPLDNRTAVEESTTQKADATPTTPASWKPNPLDYTYKPPVLPTPTEYRKCLNRPVHWKFQGHSYFYSAHEASLNLTDANGGPGPSLTWDDAFAVCRQFCMDPVNIETEAEWNMVRDFIDKHRVQYTWTSGRKCDFKGCNELENIEPNIVNGWFWLGSQVRLSPTDKPPVTVNGTSWRQQPWLSRGDSKKYPQPDNAEFFLDYTKVKRPESCLGLIWRIYDVDRPGWHDIACYHKKYVMCEDNDYLLEGAYHLDEANRQLEAENAT